MNKLAIIQARMSSSRLPGKVLMDITGRPMLEHVVVRTMKARSVDGIVIATTTDPSDDVLEQYCLTKGISCWRGSLHDVLDRFYLASVQFSADVIIRLTADCPLLDPDVIRSHGRCLPRKACEAGFNYFLPQTCHPIPDFHSK